MARVSKFKGNNFKLFKISGSMLSSLAWICIASLMSVILRWQEIFSPSLIDWDENTFLTVASESLRGHLPFTSTIENKPPLALVFQTAALGISNHDLVTLRLICSILVSITGVLLGLSVCRLTEQGNWLIVLLSSGIYTLLVSSIPSGLSWGSEINTNLIFALLIFTLINFIMSGTLRYFYLSAFLVGILPMFRTNWLPISILCFVYLLFTGKNKSWKIALSGIALFPALSIALLYVVKGFGAELYKYGIEMPLFINFVSVPEYRFSRPQGADKYLLISLALSCFIYFFFRNRKIRLFLNFLLILLLTQYFVLTLQSPNYSHHTIQLVPFLVVISILFLTLTIEKIKILKVIFIVANPILIISMILLAESSIVGDNGNNRNISFLQMKQTSKWVKTFNQERIWALNSNYIFWMNDLTPPQPYLTHPSHMYVPGFVEFIRNENRSVSEYIDEIIASDVGVFYLNPNPYSVNNNLDSLRVLLSREGYRENVKNFGGNKFSFWEK